MNVTRHFMKNLTKKQRLSTITLAIAIVYLIFDSMARIPDNTSHISPAAGVVVAAAYVFGVKSVPGVLISSLAGGLVSIFLPNKTMLGHPIAGIAFLTIIQVLATLITAHLMKRWTNRQNLLASSKDVLHFLLSGPLMFSAVMTVGMAVAYAFWPPVRAFSLASYGFGLFVGAMVSAPLLIALCDDTDYVNEARPYEWLISFTALIFFGFFLLFFDYSIIDIQYRVMSLILLPMFWIALRFNKRSVELFIFSFYLVVWLGSVYGSGFYALFPSDIKEANLQMFIGSSVLLTLFTNAISTELHRSKSEIVDLYVGLELKVDERTRELSAANQGLNAMNDELEQSNTTLKAEIEERQRLENELKAANQELNFAMGNLKLTQNQLIQSEKMASLGVLVAGVAHEINSPVGVSVTAVSHLTEIAQGIKRQLEHESPDRAEISDLIEDLDEGISIILSNLRRASHLIQSFKMVSTDQSTQSKRLFKLKPYIDEVIFSLQPKLKKTKHSIQVICREEIEIDSYPGAFSQILTNLILNSLIHAFNEEDKGQIDITMALHDQTLLMKYHDNGHGIPAAYIDKIFDPFFTTNRQGGGTGLGLFVVYNLVTQQLGGTITCDSTAETGTTFTIEINLGGSAYVSP